MSLRKECAEFLALDDVFRDLSLDGKVRAWQMVVSSMSTHTAFEDIIGKRMQVQRRWLQIRRECTYPVHISSDLRGGSSCDIRYALDGKSIFSDKSGNALGNAYSL